MKLIVKSLQEVGPMTMAELTDLLAKDRIYLQKSMQRLRAKKKVRICDWRRCDGQGEMAPIYALGSGPDAPKPPAKTPAQLKREYYARNAVRISIQRYGAGSRVAGGGVAGPFAGLLFSSRAARSPNRSAA